jgi:DNA-binding HxlR family transcriptional regulator
MALVVPDVLEESRATETLRGMEADALVERRVLRESAPQHVEYALTDLGKTLQEPLAAICEWRRTTLAAVDRHAAGRDVVSGHERLPNRRADCA